MKIEANIVTVTKEDSVTWVGFSDDEQNTKSYVLLSFNEEEPNDGLYIEVNDQKWGGYKLVQSVHFLDTSVVLDLTEAGAKELETNRQITIAIPPKIQNWPSLKTKISALLRHWVPVSH